MPVVVSCVRHCQKVVTQILLSQNTVAVAAKLQYLDKPDAITLLQVATQEGRVYIFDLKKSPNLIHEGLLWRILISPDLTKVMHDCRSVSTLLKKQYKVTMNGVFDTQAAYCVLMIHNGLPPRYISLDQLYYKYGQPTEGIMHMLQESLSGVGLYWAQRPLSKQMILEASSDVLALMPYLHNSMKRELCEKGLADTKELTYAYIHGYFQSSARSKASHNDRVDSASPLLKLSGGQRDLLLGTITYAH